MLLLIDGLGVWRLLFVVVFNSFEICVVLDGLRLVCDLSRFGLLVGVVVVCVCVVCGW